MLSVGTEAPDFSLTRRVREAPVRLSDFRGERTVVLLFFPLAFSGVCTAEMCQVAEDYSRWTGLNAEILGISIDSPWVNAKFAEETGAAFPILSDFNKDVSTAYGVLYDDFFGMRGVSKRSAFVVDRDGIIRYAWMEEDSSIMPPFDEIAEAVAALR
ncbi:MAG: redoxin domain-containing protein [Gemmatimonadota bacterium]|nr:redoxin domain-containing protein [Gemmatimonadota bacterium]